ncbi:LLM class flavin-dependent oxidoreductase [Nocardia sp. NPDC005978]|uniref:LLM class flavin-dependent oxidoreductase n=1 Tax=Nocardia sp. NPDC005978 TaxID=3156725 RepID=UPI0033A4E3A2
MRFHWFLPTAVDGRTIATGTKGTLFDGNGGTEATIGTPPRKPSIGYMSSIAMAAEQAGFDALLTPVGIRSEDAWVVSSAIAHTTDRIRFLVALRPGMMSPTLCAAMAATFERAFPGRLGLNIVLGGDPAEQRMYGDFLQKSERLRRADEFLAVYNGLMRGESVTYGGEHIAVEQACIGPGVRNRPEVFFGGSSDGSIDTAARRADVYLSWGDTEADIADRAHRFRRAAAAHGRCARVGTRFHVIARDTEDAAWAEAAHLMSGLARDDLDRTIEVLSRSESAGQSRMLSLHERYRSTGDPQDLEVSPGIWAGIGLMRGGAGASLVGSFATVRAKIAELGAMGIDDFILSGFPHLEEAWRVGEEIVTPLAELERFGTVPHV